MPRKKVVKKPVKKVEEPVKEAVEEVAKEPVMEDVIVCKDENGRNGKVVKGFLSADGKSVITLEGVTYAV